MACHPPALITVDEGLMLRLAEVADADEIARVVALSLDHLSPWMEWATPQAAEPDEQRRRREAARPDEGKEYTYLLLAESTMVGAFGLHRRVGPGAIEIGYWLAPFATGQGYATRAAKALTDEALKLADVQRVEIHCDQANTRSAAIPQRLGYRLDRVEPDDIEAPNEVGLSMVWVTDAPSADAEGHQSTL